MYASSALLTVFFDHPLEEFHIRKLARMTKIHPNTIMSLTDKLAKEGVLLKSKKEMMVVVRANTGHWLYILKKREHNIERLFRSGLMRYLEDRLTFPTIILFGSYAKSENHPQSDIDLCILTEGTASVHTEEFERKLHAPIQIFRYDRKSFHRLRKDNVELANNIINGIVLSGFLEAYG